MLSFIITLVEEEVQMKSRVIALIDSNKEIKELSSAMQRINNVAEDKIKMHKNMVKKMEAILDNELEELKKQRAPIDDEILKLLIAKELLASDFDKDGKEEIKIDHDRNTIELVERQDHPLQRFMKKMFEQASNI